MAFCKQLGAKELIITHFSQHYKRPGDVLEDTVDKLVIEAREAIEELVSFSDPTLCEGKGVWYIWTQSLGQGKEFECSIRLQLCQNHVTINHRNFEGPITMQVCSRYAIY